MAMAMAVAVATEYWILHNGEWNETERSWMEQNSHSVGKGQDNIVMSHIKYAFLTQWVRKDKVGAKCSTAFDVK